jgi:predicted ABC-type transport system involved in lysophospholipase L1 biosynthesis ATPase subunit
VGEFEGAPDASDTRARAGWGGKQPPRQDRYGEGETAVDALRGVSLDVADGRLTAIMGPSRSGKSTLMHILAGLDRPTSGSVRLDGIEITDLNDKKLTMLRREKIGFVFQFFNLLPMLTAEENVVLPLTIAGRNRKRSGSTACSAHSGSPSAVRTGPRSFGAASSSASRSPARS